MIATSQSIPQPPADASISQEDGLAYWSQIDPTIDGMLGGFAQISQIDLAGSLAFMKKLRRSSSHPSSKPLARAVDCGAGIGRITTGLLIDIASTVDIVEPVPTFTTRLKTSGNIQSLQRAGRIGGIFQESLQTWTPTVQYDLIWNQWCLGHLTDAQLVAYLERCAKHLAPGGWIVVKENIVKEVLGARDTFDEVDSSVTRLEKSFERIFGRAGLRVVRTELQSGLPAVLYPVRSWALQPVV